MSKPQKGFTPPTRPAEPTPLPSAVPPEVLLVGDSAELAAAEAVDLQHARIVELEGALLARTNELEEVRRALEAARAQTPPAIPEGDLGEAFREIMIDHGLAFTTRSWIGVPDSKKAAYRDGARAFLEFALTGKAAE